jgi:flagellar assembly protein FliH
VEQEEHEDLMEEYTGPTVDDLKREAEIFQKKWEEEKKAMVENASSEAQSIMDKARQTAFDEIRMKSDEAATIKESSKAEAEAVIAKARQQSEEMIAEASAKVEQIEKSAFTKGYDEGHADGYREGRNEAERLIGRLHLILTKAIEKRNEIIEDSENQIVHLVLLIANKVVKVISESQKNVVVNNVVQALRKLKSRGDIVIRVNIQDVELTTAHIEDFMKMVENVKSITVMEDSAVDPGGCVIETDFGQIDARISSQLKEIEEKILELAPIKGRGEGA